jgi:hypothetical protein
VNVPLWQIGSTVVARIEAEPAASSAANESEQSGGKHSASHPAMIARRRACAGIGPNPLSYIPSPSGGAFARRG